MPRASRDVLLQRWQFEQSAEGWAAEHQCRLAVEQGHLKITSVGNDPYFHCPVRLPGGRMRLEVRARTNGDGPGSVFWTTDRQPARSESRRADFPLPADGRWHTNSTVYDAPGTLTDIRIDPGVQPGEIEFDSITVYHVQQHPLTVESVEQTGRQVVFHIRNHAAAPTSCRIDGRQHSIPPGDLLDVPRPINDDLAVQRIAIRIEVDSWPPLERAVFAEGRPSQTGWHSLPCGKFQIAVAPDGTAMRVMDGDQWVASFAPLVIEAGQAARLSTISSDRAGISLANRDTTVRLIPTDNGELEMQITSQVECEGPVVRVRGDLVQGLFAGLEYLGKRERSSSSLDIESAEHIRFAPDPLKVTMPLMSVVTEGVSVALTWTDMSLQPVYACPNFFDGDSGHRMSIRGSTIRASVRLSHSALEENILWAVQRHGLPSLPEPPRSNKAQDELCLQALAGPLRSEHGWGHCVQQRWKRRPFADMASTWWRLSGEIPQLSQLVPGGAHIENPSIYFVTGKVDQWLVDQRRRTQSMIHEQRADGSFRYHGKYARGHFEDTASGYCAVRAMQLLRYAYITGDPAARRAGLKSLTYMQRFRTPRGAQTWECPLHTPDLLAAAYLVRAYVTGYRITGNREFLQEARRWALTGMPFVYLWSRYPVMVYATPPVYGATNWRAPNWMGLPVQWVGIVYAYALGQLAPLDKTLDWHHIARGILISAQQQQYPQDDYRGLLPDSFRLESQRRQPADINPCAIVSLQSLLDGHLDSLAVAANDHHRVAAPFPVTIRGNTASIAAHAGIEYQILVDGDRQITVRSQGHDQIELGIGDSP